MAEPIVAKSALTDLGYTDVDWSTRETGYVRVVTERGSRYLVKVSNVIDLRDFDREVAALEARIDSLTKTVEAIKRLIRTSRDLPSGDG